MPTPTKYTYSVASDFPVTGLASDAMDQEIRNSSIVTALDRIDVSGDVCDIWFKDALSAGDKTTLDNDATGPSGGLIAAHLGEPLAKSPSEVIIQEEETKTGGHYQAYSVSAAIPASTGWHEPSEFIFSFPIPISLLSAEAMCKAENDQDEIEFQIAPDTTIGSISSDEGSGQTVLSVAQSVIDNTKVGYYVKLDDGTNVDDCGRVKSINTATNEITVETATTNSFLAATPTYVKQTVKMVPLLELTDGLKIILGESKIGGSYIAAGTTFKMRYNNKDGVAKRFSFVLEYLY